MELVITKEESRPYLVVIKDDEGKTIRKFFTLNTDHIEALEQDELEQQVKDGVI